MVMAIGPTSDYFGPYYRQQRRATEVQQRATGLPETPPSQRAAEEYGMLSAWGERKGAEEKFQWQKSAEERRLEMEEDKAKAQERAGTIGGIATLAGLGATAGTATATALGTGGALSLAGIGIPGLALGPIGAILGGLGGLIFGKKKVICTELHRQGLLSDEIYLLDSYYGNQLPDDVLIGYKLWAIPITNAMKQSRLLTHIISWIAIPWAYEMAHRINPDINGNILGRIINILGVPICRYIGRIIIAINLHTEEVF